MIVSTPYASNLLDPNPRLVIDRIYGLIISKADKQGYMGSNKSGRSITPYCAKGLEEVPGMIKQVIRAYEARTGESGNPSSCIYLTEEKVDTPLYGGESMPVPANIPDTTTVISSADDAHLPCVTFSLLKHSPGAFGQGAPFESEVHNYRPILREEGNDPDNPGYKRAVFGYFHDNLMRLTYWSGTNKEANLGVDRLEKILQEYNWWLVMSGIPRFIFWQRGTDMTAEVNQNHIYGRPLDYYIKTEQLTYVSQKKLEEFVLQISVAATTETMNDMIEYTRIA